MKKNPKGKYIGMVKVGEKGQIVIPKGARDLFGVKPGDSLILLADTKRGIAIVPDDFYSHMAEKVFPTEEIPCADEEEE
ncbi:MAG: AbrB/MazE/SpoVT family DNA-binding domain-containing protein [Christensenella sp.]|nr:AbrB/MazE/SpoVT family DNA-binding domain-containing protein [Christensenella sp.]